MRERVLSVTAAKPRVIDVDGVATSILEAGDGPPLLLLHGGVESGAAVWAPVLDRLATSHRVVAPDIPGLGESEPIASLDAGAFSSWLQGTMQALDMDRPTVWRIRSAVPLRRGSPLMLPKRSPVWSSTPLPVSGPTACR